MSLTPLLAAGPVIAIHALCAIVAFFLGALVLWRRKGTALHKTLGRIWVVLMLVVATSALFISEIRLIGPFSPIHLLAILTYGGIGRGLWAIIVKRDVAVHRASMQAVYLGSLVLAGAFTFLPGRRMHDVLFGAGAGWAPALILIGVALVASVFLWRQWRTAPIRAQAQAQALKR